MMFRKIAIRVICLCLVCSWLTRHSLAGTIDVAGKNIPDNQSIIVHNEEYVNLEVPFTSPLFYEQFTYPDGLFGSNSIWTTKNINGMAEVNPTSFQIKNNALNMSGSGAFITYTGGVVPEGVEDYTLSLDMTIGSKHTNGSYFIGFLMDPVTKNRYEIEYHTIGIFRILESTGLNSVKKLTHNINWPLKIGQKYNVKITVDNNGIGLFVDNKHIYSHPISLTIDKPTGISLMTRYQHDVLFDNVMVDGVSVDMPEQEDNKISLMSLSITDGLKNNIDGGTVVLARSAALGEAVNIKTFVKDNYSFLGYTFINQLDGTYVDIQIVDHKFIMPDYPVIIEANFASKANISAPITYYVDPMGGNDENNGISEQSAIRSIAKVNSLSLNPGDKVLFKAGSSFNATESNLYLLKPNGSGTLENPILVGMYGHGHKPRLNGIGLVENVVYLENQQNIIIENLEITNEDPSLSHSYELNKNTNTGKLLRGVRVYAADYGVVNNIVVRNLYIHNINGNLKSKWNGGIFFDAKGSVALDEYTGEPYFIGVPTKYNNILIENNVFENVDRSGIKMVGSDWCNRSFTNNKAVPINWFPSTNIVVRGNYMDDIGGDGITVRDTDGALIEYNLVRESNKQEAITGYNVAIWPFQADNSVVQYNEAYLTYGLKDGQGFDADHLSKNTVIQYNYSHDNVGGFVLVMGWYQISEKLPNGDVVTTGQTNTGATIRYNISQNDLDHTFEITRGIPNGLAIYNNTIYLDKKLKVGVFDLPGFGTGESTLHEDYYVFNNIFYYTGDAATSKFFTGNAAGERHLKEYAHFTNNAYYGINPPEQDKNPIVLNDLGLYAAGSGPNTNTGLRYPIAGLNLMGELDGYRLKANSGLIDMGVSLQDIYNSAKYKDKIYGVASNPFAQINGVDYNLDFFGGDNSHNTGIPDIGAFEFNN